MAITIASTRCGTAAGVALHASCTVFRGIPYARAKRFMPPTAPEAWEGVRTFDAFSPICPQVQPKPGMPFSDFFIKEFYPKALPMSEDSLCLNVWTPAWDAGEALPVMVWFHGGGMGSGYGHEMEFDGEALAARGVVLVTLNYRLGCFGYFTHPDLSEGANANNAIRDQQMALRWVRENIGVFGGNPGNVTIFGQSAGGGSVISHLCSPHSEGLFHKCIIQSGFGGITQYGAQTLADTQAWCENACRMLEKTAADLAALPMDELLAAFAKAEQQLGPIPKQVQDGVVFTSPPGKQVLKKVPAGIPMMVGSVSGDNFIPGEGRQRIEPNLRRRYDTRADVFMEKHPPDDPAFAGIYEGLEKSVPWFDELAFCVQVNNTNPIYMYHFCPRVPGHNESGFVPNGCAFHSSELWYMFGTLERCWRPFDEKHCDLSARMLDYWTNFARYDSPNGNDVAVWPQYVQQTYSTLMLTENGDEVRQLMDDDVWPLVAFRVFPDA